MIQLLEQRAGRTVIFCGHRNAISRVERGKIIQFSCPQPVQFPCGWLSCALNGGFLRVEFRPIADEALRQISRVQSAACGHAIFDPTYRVNQWSAHNCVIPLSPP